MSECSQQRSLLRKTLEISSSTFLSRVLGLVRQVLLMRYLGAGAASDAFVTAFRIPNSLRKIFAEGALSAAFIPSLVKVLKNQGRDAASRLMTRMFFIIGGIVLGICLLITINADVVIKAIAPGFSTYQVALAVPLLRVLIFFIFFIAGSALIAGALQAVHHFSIPAFGQVVLNLVVIAGLCAALYYHLPIKLLAWIFILGAFIVFLMHIVAYMRYQFTFLASDVATKCEVKQVLRKFVPCILSVSMVEMNLFIDAQFASFLPVGSIALLANTGDWMRIPLSILVVSFCTILLPHISRVGSYAPARLSYYLHESIKALIWTIIPIAVIMMFFSYDIFNTIFLSDNFSYAQVLTSQKLLIIFLSGLFFFSINKVMLNMFYALHVTFIPSLITVGGTALNTLLNFFMMRWFGVYGLAAATSIAASVQTLVFLAVLHKRFKFTLYPKNMVQFIGKTFVQFICVMGAFYGLFVAVRSAIGCFPEPYKLFFLCKLGYWLWVGPLCGLAAIIFFVSRRFFGIRIYFFD